MLGAHICRSLAADALNQTPLDALQLHLTLQVVGTYSHHSLSLAPPLQGAKRSVALILALAKATCSSGLQKNSHFLSGTRWGAPSFLCSPVLPRRLLSDLSSRGLVKITWQGRVKGPDEPRVPGVPQTSAEFSVLLKWRGHWKGGASSRQGVSHYWICRKVARWVNKFLAHSKRLQPLGIKFNLHNMLEPLWCKWISFFFLSFCSWMQLLLHCGFLHCLDNCLHHVTWQESEAGPRGRVKQWFRDFRLMWIQFIIC